MIKLKVKHFSVLINHLILERVIFVPIYFLHSCKRVKTCSGKVLSNIFFHFSSEWSSRRYRNLYDISILFLLDMECYATFVYGLHCLLQMLPYSFGIWNFIFVGFLIIPPRRLRVSTSVTLSVRCSSSWMMWSSQGFWYLLRYICCDFA